MSVSSEVQGNSSTSSAGGPSTLEEAAMDRLEMNNLHTLQTVQALNRDFRWVEQNREDTRRMLRRGEPYVMSGEVVRSEGGAVSEDDTVNWKTQQTHNYYPQEAKEKPAGVLSKLAGPLLIAAGLMGTGGIGGAAFVAGKAIEHFAKKQEPAPVVEQSPIESSVDVRFVGGEK